MATQINTEELSGCISYLEWMIGKVQPAENGQDDKLLERLCRFLFGIDYSYEVAEDDIRAKDAVDMRKVYAEEAGSEAGKNEHDIDRIWKSIHGKCSVMELILRICTRLDEMVNEGEEGSMVPVFFLILCENAGFLETKDGETENDKDPENDWKDTVERLMDRKYEADGSGGGLFPLKKWEPDSEKDQRKIPIWDQMNAWLNENLDDEEHFMVEKFV